MRSYLVVVHVVVRAPTALCEKLVKCDSEGPHVALSGVFAKQYRLPRRPA